MYSVTHTEREKFTVNHSLTQAMSLHMTHIGLYPVNCAWVDVDYVSFVLSEPVDWDLVSVELIQDGPPGAWGGREGSGGRESGSQ